MKKDIKIFVSCHKPSNVIKNELIYPIQVGTALSNKVLPNMLHDNEGINISHKNKMYCELTAQYYVWKNIQADYYGFFHYRRYLTFSNKKHKENYEGIYREKLDNSVIKDFGLDEANMRNIIEQYDVIAPKQSYAVNVYGQYCLALTQNKRDIDFCLKYIYEHYPEMKKIAKKAIHSSTSYFCNMFIMKKEIFNQYCSWLFEILEAHEKAMPLEHYDVQAYRVSGYLAERLCAIYLKWLKSQPDIKFKEVQRVMFGQTDDSNEIMVKNSNVCPVLLNVSNKNFLNSAVLLNSIIDNAKQENNYQIFINNLGLKYYQINYFKRLKYQNNIAIKIISEKCLKNITNFKFVANSLKHMEKIIYLSSNCVVNTDIYNLFDTKIESCVAGTRNLNDIIKCGKTKLKRQAEKINKSNPYEAISSNVLLLNLAKIRKEEIISSQIIDLEWNVIINEAYKIEEKIYAFAPYKINNEYVNALKNPSIVSFEGKITPLHNPLVQHGNLFWENAKKTPIYEICELFLFKNFRKIRQSVYDTLFPIGSTRRLFTKTYIKKY